ncbi:MAG: DNA/RNA helicase [Rhodospirillales bacterium]|nr:MAG: DNA/RNA helicase [Rhodospirillales bacterium]
MRDILLERLKQDLVGPYTEDEVLTSRPSDVYLTGILWPREARMGAEEDERLGLSGGEESETGGAGEEEEVSLAGLMRPCSAGVSFAARAANGDARLNVRIGFATYQPVEPPAPGREPEEAGSRPRSRMEWHRRAHDITVSDVAPGEGSRFIGLDEHGAPSGIRLHLRTAAWSGGTLVTVTLLNYAEPEEDEGRDGVERLTLFQVNVQVRPGNGAVLVARPSRRAVLDDDDRSAELLYRKAHEFATGHTCSAEWAAGTDPGTATMVGTSWVPRTTVPATSAAGHEVFDALRANEKYRPLSARWLAGARAKEMGEALLKLPEAYKKWIDTQEAAVSALPAAFREQATKNIATCRQVHDRIAGGASRIAGDDAMSHAFRLANLAMALQHSWDPEKSSRGPLEWRPFQLGFILLAAASVADRKHRERGIMDLLWFPTGGGKTEAYLALIAFLSFYRRLSAGKNPDDGDGVAAVMRYTLRLLTTQQFSRAASVLLACEAIRRGRIREAGTSHRELGRSPFSIGLWVGGDAVPNRVRDAAAALGGSPDQPSPKQLVQCPACRQRLDWSHDEQADAIQVRCVNSECLLYDAQAPLPVWTVDEDVYRQRPTLLIGTIDKFAQIVRRKEVSGLFSIGTGSPPDLILQDELHLISGPLGTVAGLYEAAIDRMFSSGDTRPKIIGSTATIRRASEQVAALFDRQTEQFPPSCLDADDSGFAVVDRGAPGRVYVGVTTAGRSAKFTLQAVAASLLQAAYGGTVDDQARDPYWTLVTYFNSLRELGGALVLMQDDVNDSLAILAQRREETARQPEFIEELTSRRTQADVRDMLDRLAVRSDAEGALDVVLATNMLSVGVDIPRLGLMLVNGQPKGIAEYIQATSRVGRGSVPGLVVSVLNNAKARDRSHYESFPTWHSTLYRDVEPTSVTPFASRARDRALHAVLVALVRHLAPGMLDRPALDVNAINAARDLINEVVRRSTAIDPEETAVRLELERRLDTWEFRAPRSYWSRQVRSSLLQDAERAATLRAMGRLPGEAWPTLNNMRSVEASTRYRLAEWLRQRTAGENSNGQ